MPSIFEINFIEQAPCLRGKESWKSKAVSMWFFTFGHFYHSDQFLFIVTSFGDKKIVGVANFW